MTCRVCHRPLTDPGSMALGIGPTCRQQRVSAAQLSLGIEEDGREPEGVEDGQNDHEKRRKESHPRFEVVETDRGDGQGRPVQAPPPIKGGYAGAFDHVRPEVIRWPLRAPYWRRVWQWVLSRVRL